MKEIVTACRNGDNLLEDLRKEIARINRYNAVSTVILIELSRQSEDLDSKDLSEIDRCLNETFRDSDMVYRVAHNRFSIILPFTHEAGGEAVAMRLKRVLPEKVFRQSSSPCTVNSSVVCLRPQEYQGPEELIAVLEHGLQTSKEFMPISSHPDDPNKSYKEETFSVICLEGKEENASRISTIIRSLEYGQRNVGSPDDVLKAIRMSSSSVVVIPPEVSHDITCSIFEKIRLKGLLSKVVGLIFTVNNVTEDSCVFDPYDAMVVKACDIEKLGIYIELGRAFIALKNLRNERDKLVTILTSVGKSSHQMSQPFQVILGKLDLLGLTHVEEAMKQEISGLKGQVMRAADINRKIERLVKSVK